MKTISLLNSHGYAILSSSRYSTALVIISTHWDVCGCTDKCFRSTVMSLPKYDKMVVQCITTSEYTSPILLLVVLQILIRVQSQQLVHLERSSPQVRL